MSIVIATKNQYVVADKIHHVTLDEHKEYDDVRGPNGKLIGVVNYYFSIAIIYTPEAGANGRSDKTECNIKILSKVDAYKIYRDLIQQIREQSPDQLFLDKVFENLLTSDDFLKIEQENLNLLKDNWYKVELEAKNDRSTKKTRKLRKKKK